MKTYIVNNLIDTSKCKTDEELFDALEYAHYMSGIEQLEKRLWDMRTFMKTIDSYVCQLEDQVAKYERCINAYKEVYPNRPWEVCKLDPIE